MQNSVGFLESFVASWHGHGHGHDALHACGRLVLFWVPVCRVVASCSCVDVCCGAADCMRLEFEMRHY